MTAPQDESRCGNGGDGDETDPGGVARPADYDSRYFSSFLGGYKEFRDSGGRRLAPRFQKALEMAAVAPGQRVLDIGCGRGELVIHSALRGATAVGIDFAADAVGIAARAVDAFDEVRGRACVLRMDAREMAFGERPFDTVFLSDIVEHLYPEELAGALEETRRVLRPGGRLVVHTCPNKLLYDVTYPIYIRQVHRVVCRIAELARYQSYVITPSLAVGREFPRNPEEKRMHVNEQTGASLARALRAGGFRIIKIQHWESPSELPYVSRRITIELMLLDALRFLRPFSYGWPLNRLFTNQIFVVAERR
jgi:ubiquinone/menaquinone biosynthesis C-methylase UbiE